MGARSEVWDFPVDCAGVHGPVRSCTVGARSEVWDFPVDCAVRSCTVGVHTAEMWVSFHSSVLYIGAHSVLLREGCEFFEEDTGEKRYGRCTFS